MYEVQRSRREVKGRIIETWKAELVNANILEIEVGTNGYCGGDTGHGSRTYLRISDEASTDMSVSVIQDGLDQTKEVTIELGGDTELSTFIEALEFAVKVLKDQSETGRP